MATKFGENEQRSYENGDNFSCELDIDTDFGYGMLSESNVTPM